ncbi:DNA-methyltransferase [Rubinisphaera brasiliensis]|uniref:Methyltransferase n=1 Tax=Rubinisphaera brasiliensis (strain ATCC 49424 / DSM 5305 / JCM 21570 / IAM 15109 / NBRC 103401 / IFAM 1448) TaxID=756272 RepID=F0SJ63_RUBBR|nr:site-specific DNA-methyltransferase [Rubinisphaera brasiliensis]ADY58605.1 DNA methylase N-4/N-6 domain protein [Rubinisphaera brasiliensis DSM 5305]
MNEFVNQVFHADARHLLAKLPEESIDAVICDPMYGTAKNYEYEWGIDPANGDPELHWEYHKPIYEECRRVLKPGGALAWGQGAKFCEHFQDWLGNHRVWTITRFRPKGKSATGHAWVVQTREQKPIPMPDRDSLVICDNVGPIRKLHPCIKMVEELKFVVEELTKPGDIVLDCCCGLGSTLLAAEQLGRRWIGCDISQRYSQIAKLRMENLRSHMESQGSLRTQKDFIADRC